MSRGHRHLDALLRLDRLVEAVAPCPALGRTARELVDDHDLVVAHHVLAVTDEELPRLEGPLDGVVEFEQAHAIEECRSLLGPHAASPAAQEFAGLLLHVGLEVFVALERVCRRGREAEDRLLDGLRLARRRGDDQRRAGLVDEHVVGLVDEGKPIRPLEELRRGRGGPPGEHRPEIGPALRNLAVHEPVLEEVEAEFLGGAVGDVAGVGCAPSVKIHLRLDDPHRQSERLVDRLHPLGVAAGEVVIHGGQVRALAGERIHDERQRGHERLPLARLHLHDRPVHEGHAGQKLHVVVPHPDRAPAGLARGGEALDDQRVDRFTGLGPVGERTRQPPQGRVAQGLHFGREVVDLLHDPPRGARDRGAFGSEPVEHCGACKRALTIPRVA